jgi:hypothetical protein
MEAASGTVDDRLRATQQNFEAVLLDRGVETADDGNFCISQSLSEVVGFEDWVARAFDGAEEGDRRFLKQAKIADHVQNGC